MRAGWSYLATTASALPAETRTLFTLISATSKLPVSGIHRRTFTMQAFIGATLLNSKEAQPQSKPFEISDHRLSGFMLRVQPSGVRSYYACFGRNR